MEKAKNENIVEEWISTYKTEATQKTIRYRFNRFLKWSKLTGEELGKLTTKEAKTLALQYQSAAIKKGVKNNTILAVINSVRAFFGHLERPLRLKGKLVEQKMATGYHKFSNGDLGQMYNVGNAFDKALLAVGVSLGWEISEILNLDLKQVEMYVHRARETNAEFFSFESQRKKTGAHRFGILNPLALEALERYFGVEKLADGKLFDVTDPGANKLLRRLAREANISLTGKIRWHNLRKWLMSKLSKAGFNVFQIKYVMGKKIPITDLTYLENIAENIMGKYPEAYRKYLSILRYETKNQTDEIAELRKELEETRLIMRGMQKLYGKELVERALKELGIKVPKAQVARIKEPKGMDELMIRIARLKKRE